MTWARILLLSECFEGATPWDFFLLCGPIGTALPKAPLSCLSQGPSRNGYQRVWTVYCSFLERSVGNVRHFFWLLFRMTWTRILLLFECFEGATPWDFFLLCRPLGTALPKAPLSCLSHGPSRNGYQRVWTVYCSFLERSVGNVRHFFWLLFRMTWARILLLRVFRRRYSMGLLPAVGLSEPLCQRHRSHACLKALLATVTNVFGRSTVAF